MKLVRILLVFLLMFSALNSFSYSAIRWAWRFGYWAAYRPVWGTNHSVNSWRDQIWNGAAAWSNAGSRFTFIAYPRTIFFAFPDGMCEVGRGELNWYTIARVQYWYYWPTKYLGECDMTFNWNKSWTLSGESGKYDVWNFSAHEFGHFLQLNDLYASGDYWKTMYGYGSAGETYKRTLDTDDINGIKYIYGTKELEQPGLLASQDGLALNNSAKVVLSENKVLNLVYVFRDTIYAAKSFDGGENWNVPILLGEGRFPALTNDSEGELHAVWIRRIPPEPEFNPTQGRPDYLPGCYTYQVEYKSTYNGLWDPDTFDTIFTLIEYIQNIPSGSLILSAPSISVTSDNSIHIFFEKILYLEYSSIWVWKWQLIYGHFCKNNPNGIQWAVIDSMLETLHSPPSEWSDTLRRISDPGSVVDNYGNLHVTYAISNQIRYNVRENGNWCGIQEISSPIIGAHYQPSLGINGDEVTVAWQGDPIPGPASQIFCRRRFLNSDWGNIERLDDGGYYSVYPICLRNQVLWSEGIGSPGNENYEIYYSYLKGYKWSAPENLSQSPSRSILSQATYNSGILYYFYIEGNEPPYTLVSKKKVIPEPIPYYAVDLGSVIPSSGTIHRDGFIVYGGEPYMTVDYDSSKLIYSLTGFAPDGKYEIEWVWYHQSNERWKERLRIDNILNEHKWVPPGERVTIRKPVPQAVVQDGIMEITNEITAGNGLSILDGFAIYDLTTTGGGPQSNAENTIVGLSLQIQNPVVGTPIVRYSLPVSLFVRLKIYDVTGVLVRAIRLGKMPAGLHEAHLEDKDNHGRSLAAGIYFICLETEMESISGKLIMVK